MSTLNVEPGDFFLVRTNHFVSKLIRLGQRGYGKDAAQWNHVALYIGGGKIVEALTGGVVESNLDKYPEKDRRLQHVYTNNWLKQNTNIEQMRYNAVGFARSCVGEKYGWMTIIAIGLKTLFKGRWNFGIQGTSICSGLVARSLERLGYNFQPYDPAELTPAYLASRPVW